MHAAPVQTRRLDALSRAAGPRSSGASDGEPHWPLAEAKLAAQEERSGLVERPRVLQTLDAGAGARLTLVAAPAGAGKSTAVRAWCAHRNTRYGWLTLDAQDNDPVRLWTYVAAAVDRMCPGVGPPAVRRLHAATSLVEPVDVLLNGIAAAGTDLVLVLDDLQTVTDVDCMASLDHALERLPSNLRLIALTRIDPALRLAHLRARGALAELRAEELAFSPEEAHRLLVDLAGLDLGREDVHLLHERTEGWPAALVLAALWLGSVDDPRIAVREFGGDHRFVVDYLTAEVLDALHPDDRAFLLRVAVLGRVTAPLCDGVLGGTDAAIRLEQLVYSNQFFARLERGGWYRMHPLLSQFARFRLAAEEPGAEREIHVRASDWLQAQGQSVEAVAHAAAVGDHATVARLLVDQHLAMLQHGGGMTLLHWVRTLPSDVMVEHPELAVGGATAATMLGRAVERRRLLQLADRARGEYPERCSTYVEAVAGMVRAVAVDSDVDAAVEAGRRAVALAADTADSVLVGALAGYARALYFAGDSDAAWAAALRAVEHPDAPRRAPGHALARSTLALVALDRGQPGTARIHATEARAVVGAAGTSRSWLGANVGAAFGLVLAAEGDLAGAERELVHSEHLLADEVATVHHAWLLVHLARVRGERGRLAEADATLRAGRAAIPELAGCGVVAALAEAVATELRDAHARARTGVLVELPSPAELAVLRRLDSELSVRQIGEALFLSINTVRTHTRSLYRKLGVTSRADAVARAGELGLLGRSDSPT